jgi:hypothetical protein
MSNSEDFNNKEFFDGLENIIFEKNDGVIF